MDEIQRPNCAQVLDTFKSSLSSLHLAMVDEDEDGEKVWGTVWQSFQKLDLLELVHITSEGGRASCIVSNCVEERNRKHVCGQILFRRREIPLVCWLNNTQDSIAKRECPCCMRVDNERKRE